ncbi:4-hydroxy-tetrahydrodipicolinate reductase [Chitinophagales bacterium]|nr:4-hydroxy-tetrahydrodipicolinate reductase [Chitinophagales bacterium]
MKVAILGYGKMGKTIEDVLLARKHAVALKINEGNIEELTLDNLKSCDLAIEFSNPSSALSNYRLCFEAGIPVVSGTTGWLEHLNQLKLELNDRNGTLFYSPNFSIGVNIFFKLNTFLAGLMNQQDNYDVEMEEIHHKEKLDSPSGTGIKTAALILSEIERKDNWVENVKSSENELLIKVKREENVHGTHCVDYFSEEDKLTISHTAFSRKGFALGAVIAAEWVIGKKGFFGMDDMLNF